MFLEPRSTGKTPSQTVLEPPTRAQHRDEWNVWVALWTGLVFALLIAVASSHAFAVTLVTSDWLPDACAAASADDESTDWPCGALSDSEVNSSDPLNDLTDEEFEDAWVVLAWAHLDEPDWLSETFEALIADRPDDIGAEARLKPKVLETALRASPSWRA